MRDAQDDADLELDDDRDGSVISATEIARLRSVEVVARELAKRMKFSAVTWGVESGFVCVICGETSKTNGMDADGDLASLVHLPSCSVSIARAVGLLPE